MYTIIIVDDELPALKNLQWLLAQQTQWQLVASCYSTEPARQALATQPVDLILLDIQMPGQSGMEFARELSQSPHAPMIAFITAYDEHAVSAFDLFALDYLLKPYDDERFAMMLQRAEQALAPQQRASRIAGMQDFLHECQAHEAGQSTPTIQHLMIRSVGKIERIEVSEIIWLSAAGNYIEVHLADRVVLHRATLAATAARLGEHAFVRLHRTAIARHSEIISLQSDRNGTVMAHLSNGEQVRVSEKT